MTDYDNTKNTSSERSEAIIDRFESILESSPKEEEIHRFICDNPFLIHLLLPTQFVYSGRLYTKIPFGTEFISDFIAMIPVTVGPTYILFELELPSHPLFNKAGDPSAALSHAMRQILDWRQWIAEHTEYASSLLPGIHNSVGVVVIGRRCTLTRAERKRLAQFLYDTRGALDVVTYDRMLDLARLCVPVCNEHSTCGRVRTLAELRSDYDYLRQLVDNGLSVQREKDRELGPADDL